MGCSRLFERLGAGGYELCRPVHFIEHTISAYHDVAHAAGLAAINPSWMRFAAKTRPERFGQFARRIFDLPAGKNDLSCGLAGIDRFEEFLSSIGCPTSLTQLGIDDKLFTTYAKETIRIINDGNGKLPGRPAMSEQDIVEVLKEAI
jgi:alcohol dehydrogenase